MQDPSLGQEQARKIAIKSGTLGGIVSRFPKAKINIESFNLRHGTHFLVFFLFADGLTRKSRSIHGIEEA